MEQPNKASQPGTEKGFKEKVWNPILKPIIALTLITMVTSMLLALTNNVTKPFIEENIRLTTENARKELLPQADAFEEVKLEDEVPNIVSMFRATNGAGYIIQATASGYGGQVPVMVAFDESGNIAGVTFLSNNETPGLGKKINTEPWFSEQFVGLPPVPFARGDGTVDQIASATITSNAAYTGINAAIKLYSEMVQGETLDGIATASQKQYSPAAGGTNKEAAKNG